MRVRTSLLCPHCRRRGFLVDGHCSECWRHVDSGQPLGDRWARARSERAARATRHRWSRVLSDPAFWVLLAVVAGLLVLAALYATELLLAAAVILAVGLVVSAVLRLRYGR